MRSEAVTRITRRTTRLSAVERERIANALISWLMGVVAGAFMLAAWLS